MAQITLDDPGWRPPLPVSVNDDEPHFHEPPKHAALFGPSLAKDCPAATSGNGIKHGAPDMGCTAIAAPEDVGPELLKLQRWLEQYLARKFSRLEVKLDYLGARAAGLGASSAVEGLGPDVEVLHTLSQQNEEQRRPSTRSSRPSGGMLRRPSRPSNSRADALPAALLGLPGGPPLEGGDEVTRQNSDLTNRSLNGTRTTGKRSNAAAIHEALRDPQSMFDMLSVDALKHNRSSTGADAVQKFINTRQRSVYVENIWKVMEDPESGRAARAYDKAVLILLWMSILSSLTFTLDKPFTRSFEFGMFELVLDAVFILELLARFVVSKSRRTFLQNPFNIIDLLVFTSIGLRMYLEIIPPRGDECGTACVCLLAFTPVLRTCKILRKFTKVHLLLKAFSTAFEALPVMIFIYTVLLLLGGAILYLVEPRENLPSFHDATYLVFISMTTVGYGDVTPTTTIGYFMTAFLIFTSSLYMSIPLGIIGNAFNDVWKDREKLLLMQRTKDRLEQAGFSADDIPRLFNLFDADGNGQLDMAEFKWMLQGMSLGLTKERVVELYQWFDDDNSGGIDDREFIKALFPAQYYDIYGGEDDGDEVKSESDLGTEMMGKYSSRAMLSETGSVEFAAASSSMEPSATSATRQEAE
eukprot:TRINITY_DN101358_c0_g1_i1.p1 TRINITY_DN101358_c0_g1~~TRINITY_DN101358_c0_g1_i1.p1  ORF type:complete len:640 (-),score=150.90 TRINITY_DN101358_c0_g1_i1:104-2023(-)